MVLRMRCYHHRIEVLVGCHRRWLVESCDVLESKAISSGNAGGRIFVADSNNLLPLAQQNLTVDAPAPSHAKKSVSERVHRMEDSEAIRWNDSTLHFLFFPFEPKNGGWLSL